jgi:flagellar biosynthesis protein FliQ
MELLIEFLAKGFVTMLSISLPCVLTAASIGLVVGILQAVTQVQEQTIAAAPKITFVFLVIVLMGGGFITILTNFMKEGMSLAFNVIPRQDTYVLPADYYYHTRPFQSEMKDRFDPRTGKTMEIMKNPGKIPWSDHLEKSKFTPAPRGANPQPNFIERNRIMGR